MGLETGGHKNSMIKSMATRKLTVSLPQDLADRLREEVDMGRAESVSALVGDAVSQRLRCDRLEEVLAGLRRELGPPTKEDREWVRQVLGRQSSTPAP